MTRVIHVETERSFRPEESAELMAAVHGGDPSDYAVVSITAALRAYHFVGHVRDDAGMLVGCPCAFSHGVFASVIGELIVDPSARGHGAGAAPLEPVESEWPGVPVFAFGFLDTRRSSSVGATAIRRARLRC